MYFSLDLEFNNFFKNWVIYTLMRLHWSQHYVIIDYLSKVWITTIPQFSNYQDEVEKVRNCIYLYSNRPAIDCITARFEWDLLFNGIDLLSEPLSARQRTTVVSQRLYFHILQKHLQMYKIPQHRHFSIW